MGRVRGRQEAVFGGRWGLTVGRGSKYWLPFAFVAKTGLKTHTLSPPFHPVVFSVVPLELLWERAAEIRPSMLKECFHFMKAESVAPSLSS